MLGQIEIVASTQTDYSFSGREVHSDDKVTVWEAVDEKTHKPYRFVVAQVPRTPMTDAPSAPVSEEGTLILCNPGDWDRIWMNIVDAGNFDPKGECLQPVLVDLDLAAKAKRHLVARKIP